MFNLNQLKLGNSKYIIQTTCSLDNDLAFYVLEFEGIFIVLEKKKIEESLLTL